MVIGIPYRIDRNAALQQYHDLLKGALHDAGFNMSIKPVAIKTTQEMLVSGEVDGVSYDDLSDKRGRDKIVTTSFPISKTKAVIFYSKKISINPSKLESYRGTIPHNNKIILKEAEKKGLKFSEATSPYHCVEMVLEKAADYCIAIKEVGLSAVEASPEAKENIIVGENHFLDIPVYVSFRKAFKKDLPAIESALRKHLKGDLSKYPLIKNNLNTDL